MSIQIRHISNFLHEWAPPSTKMDYDNVGLLVGDPSANVSKVLTCLDITLDVVNEAIEENVDLIVAHHPLIFKKISRINPTDERGKIIFKLIKNDIGLIAAHTNLDAARDGVSFVLAETIGLTQLEFLDRSFTLSRKVEFAADASNQQAISRILNRYAAEAPLHYEVNNQDGELRKFEMYLDAHQLPALKQVLTREDIIEPGHLKVMEIENPIDSAGMGVIGTAPGEGWSQDEFLQHLTHQLDLKAIRFSGEAGRIRKVAVCGGAGVFLSSRAAAAGAQAFVTGDIKYHDYFTEQDNFLLIDVGHYESEVPVVGVLQQKIASEFNEVDVMQTRCVTNAMKVFVPDKEFQKQQPNQSKVRS